MDEHHLYSRLAKVEAVVEGLRDRLDLVMITQERALDVAKKEVDHRLAGMNNFQQRIDRTENLMSTKNELLLLERRVLDRIDGFEIRVKADQLSMWRIIWIAVGIFTAIQVTFNFIVNRL